MQVVYCGRMRFIIVVVAGPNARLSNILKASFWLA